MSNFTSFLRQAALALLLACGAGAALAGPSYHVTIDTVGMSGSGYLDFSVVGTPGSASAMATVSNLAGAFGAEYERIGAVSGSIPAGFSLANGDGDNYLTQMVTLGGLFGFDISFAGDYQTIEGSDGATFAIGLFDELFSQYTVAATFAAQPAFNGEAANLVASAEMDAVDIAPASAVPEPSQLALMLMGLCAAGFVVRRQRRCRRPMPAHVLVVDASSRAKRKSCSG